MQQPTTQSSAAAATTKTFYRPSSTKTFYCPSSTQKNTLPSSIYHLPFTIGGGRAARCAAAHEAKPGSRGHHQPLHRFENRHHRDTNPAPQSQSVHTIRPRFGGVGGHFCGRVARSATRQRLLHFFSPRVCCPTKQSPAAAATTSHSIASRIVIIEIPTLPHTRAYRVPRS